MVPGAGAGCQVPLLARSAEPGYAAPRISFYVTGFRLTDNRSGMERAYSILDLRFKWWRLVPRSKTMFSFTQPNDLLRNECTSVFPHLNHHFFIKLEPGFEPSDA